MTGPLTGLGVGTHTLVASYAGDATHPPSISEPLTIRVSKDTPPVVPFSWTTMREGIASEVQIDVTPRFPYGLDPTGLVTILEGNGVVGSVNMTAAAGHRARVQVSTLSVGTHKLHAVYDGDANYNGGVSSTFFVDVVPASGAVGLVARGETSSIRLSMTASCTCIYKIYQRTAGTSFSYVTATGATSYVLTNVQSGVVYLYRVDAYDNGNLIGISNIDTAMLVAFTDDNLQAGTQIKAVHFTQLRDAVNAYRIAAGLSTITIDAAPGQPIRRDDIQTLRDGLNEARGSFGAATYTFTDSPLIAHSVVVRARHVQELREAVR